jgi:uncharacterized protein YjbI with pentapeptide repeats
MRVARGKGWAEVRFVRRAPAAGGDGPVEKLLDAANSACRDARSVWLGYLLLGAYLLVTVGGTTYKQLLLDAPTKLPLLDVDVPLQTFFQYAPLLFVLVHAYLLVQLYLAARTLHALDAAIAAPGKNAAERATLRLRIDKFVIAQLLVGGNREFLPSLFLSFAAWIPLLAGPIFLLLAFQVTFLAYHDVFTTWIQRAALIVDLAFIWLLWPAITHPSGRFGGAVTAWVFGLIAGVWLAGSETIRRARAITAKGATRAAFADALRFAVFDRSIQTVVEETFNEIAIAGVLLLLSGATLVFSLLIATIPGEEIESWVLAGKTQFPNGLPETCGSGDPEFDFTHCFLNPALWSSRTETAWAPTAVLFEGEPDEARGRASSLFARNLVLVGLDLIDTDADKLAKVERTISLRNRDLRFATLDRADLRKADLTYAQMEGASLVGAQLQGASLEFAQLHTASLILAQLQGASLYKAQLQGALLDGAQLQGASLSFAHLHGASLGGAQLQGASLGSAQLQGATLYVAQLQGASLRGARLQGALVETTTLFDSDLYGAGLWRAELPFDTVALGETDFRAIDLSPPDAKTISSDIAAWLGAMPEDTGSRTLKKNAAARLAVLTAPMSDDQEKIGRRKWEALAARPWGDAEEQRLGADLVALACAIGNRPFVAQGIFRRIDREPNRPYAKKVASGLLATGCEGAKGLTDEELSELHKIAAAK